MFYAMFAQETGMFLGLTDEPTDDQRRLLKLECRWDWTPERAAEIAKKATGFYKGDKRVFLATDEGEWTSPRFDIVEAPKVGADVSYAFNGDYYPCGKIVSVTEGTARVVKTDTGKVFYRRRQTASWVMKGGTWFLVPGTIKRLNPEF